MGRLGERCIPRERVISPKSARFVAALWLSCARDYAPCQRPEVVANCAGKSFSHDAAPRPAGSCWSLGKAFPKRVTGAKRPRRVSTETGGERHEIACPDE